MKWRLAVAAISLAGGAGAHDLWLEKEGRGFVLQYGHRHSEHAGAKFVEYEPERVRDVLCVDEAGQAVAFQSQPGYPYRLRGSCAAVYVSTSSGYWTKTPHGTERVPKSQARMAIRSWLSYESVKRIDRWGDALAKPLATGLEITPRRDPLAVRQGEKLRVRVTLEGRPLEAVLVAYDGKPRGQTGADGEINIRIRHGGFQAIQASWRLPDPANRVDEVIHSTQLDFELPED